MVDFPSGLTFRSSRGWRETEADSDLLRDLLRHWQVDQGGDEIVVIGISGLGAFSIFICRNSVGRPLEEEWLHDMFGLGRALVPRIQDRPPGSRNLQHLHQLLDVLCPGLVGLGSRDRFKAGLGHLVGRPSPVKAELPLDGVRLFDVLQARQPVTELLLAFGTLEALLLGLLDRAL